MCYVLATSEFSHHSFNILIARQGARLVAAGVSKKQQLLLVHMGRGIKAFKVGWILPPLNTTIYVVCNTRIIKVRCMLLLHGQTPFCTGTYL